jgi:hypothetical protein
MFFKSKKIDFPIFPFLYGVRTESQGGVTVGGYKTKLTESLFMSIPSTSTTGTMTLPVTACGSV